MTASEDATRRVLLDVHAERTTQNVRWGEQNHPDGTGLPYDVETAEAARDRCKRSAANGTVTWREILFEEVWEAMAEADLEALRAELIQVAAVAAAWAEAIDRREPVSGAHRPLGGSQCVCGQPWPHRRQQ